MSLSSDISEKTALIWVIADKLIEILAWEVKINVITEVVNITNMCMIFDGNSVVV